jgi:hypothetical protein
LKASIDRVKEGHGHPLKASIDSVKEDPPLESRGGTTFTLSIDAFKGWNLL